MLFPEKASERLKVTQACKNTSIPYNCLQVRRTKRNSFLKETPSLRKKKWRQMARMKEGADAVPSIEVGTLANVWLSEGCVAGRKSAKCASWSAAIKAAPFWGCLSNCRPSRSSKRDARPGLTCSCQSVSTALRIREQSSQRQFEPTLSEQLSE